MNRNFNNIILAIDAGGTYFKYALVNGVGEILTDIKKVPVNSQGSVEDVVLAYGATIKDAVAQGYKLWGMGVSTPGPFDYEKGVSLMRHKFECIYGLPLRNIISESFNLDIPVWFCSDSNAFLMGEYLYGAGRGYTSLIGVTIGTGVGFSVIKEGKLLANQRGGPLEEIYSLPYKDGILEDIVSGRGIINVYCSLKKRVEKNITARKIGLLATQRKDLEAYEVYYGVGVALGRSIKSLIEKHNPQCLMLGGQIANSIDIIEKGIVEGIGNTKIDIKIAHSIDGAALKGVQGLFSSAHIASNF